MMLPTHAVVGLAIAAPMLAVAPELAPAALAGGLIGGILPDLDLYAGHRKTLHFPTLYLLATVPAAGWAFVARSSISVGLAFVLLAAAAHCRMDRYGGGLELEPWEATSDRGVYDHLKGRWRRPKRWIPYDGSPRDLLVLVAISVPLFVVLPDVFRVVVALAVLIGVIYTLLRRRLAAIARVVFGLVPDVFQRYVPERYQ